MSVAMRPPMEEINATLRLHTHSISGARQCVRPPMLLLCEDCQVTMDPCTYTVATLEGAARARTAFALRVAFISSIGGFHFVSSGMVVVVVVVVVVGGCGGVLVLLL